MIQFIKITYVIPNKRDYLVKSELDEPNFYHFIIEFKQAETILYELILSRKIYLFFIPYQKLRYWYKAFDIQDLRPELKKMCSICIAFPSINLYKYKFCVSYIKKSNSMGLQIAVNNIFHHMVKPWGMERGQITHCSVRFYLIFSVQTERFIYF